MVKIILALLNTVTISSVAFAQTPTPSSTPTAGAMAAAPASNGKFVVLNQKSVAEMVLKQSPRTLEVNLRYQQFRLDPATALARYDWRLVAESGFEYDKSTSLLTTTSQTAARYDRYTTSINVQKPFTTGTLLGVELTRLTQRVNYDTPPAAPAPPEQTLDRAGLKIEQSLLGNSFGIADRATVNAAELTYEANNVARADELETVVLDAIRKFWNSYVAQESFREAVNSRDRYKKLVDAVKRKTSLGYSNPGDLPQVQAEFEQREQTVKTTSYEYLKSNEDLITLLALEPGTEIRFEIPQEIPPVPKLVEKKPEDLRTIRAQKLRAQAAEEALKAANSSAYPYLDFVGRLYSTGADVTTEGSYSQVSSGDRPSYYAGLRLSYNFGSDLQSETIINRKLTRDLQNTVLSRQLLESLDSEAQSARKAQAQYTIATSKMRQREFRERASQELNRSYSQGRTDISILITAMNNFFDSEVQYIRALGDYAISLNEWAAVRDELIPDDAPNVEYKK